MLHNRYLPRWLHRICNALFGCCLVCAAGVLALVYVLPDDWLSNRTIAAAFWLGAIAGVALLFVNPERYSIVEGGAGDLGYDELEPPDARREQGSR